MAKRPTATPTVALILRLPPELHAALLARADAADLTITGAVIEALARELQLPQFLDPAVTKR